MKKEAKVDVWMPWYIGDYLSDTTNLNTQQHGAYCLMLMAAWKRDGVLPGDDAQLAAITRLGIEGWMANAMVLLPFWRRQADGSLLNNRIAEEREKAKKTSIARSKAGKEGAQGKWKGKADDKPMANAKANDEQNDAPSKSPSQSSAAPAGAPPAEPAGDVPAAPAKKVRKPRKDPGRFDAEFEVIWGEYPKRTGMNRAAALAKYTARREDGATAQELLEGTMRYAAHCRNERTEPRYVKTPEAFFGPMRHYLSDWSPIGPPRGQNQPANGKQAHRDAWMVDQPQESSDAGRESSVIDVEARRVD